MSDEGMERLRNTYGLTIERMQALLDTKDAEMAREVVQRRAAEQLFSMKDAEIKTLKETGTRKARRIVDLEETQERIVGSEFEAGVKFREQIKWLKDRVAELEAKSQPVSVMATCSRCELPVHEHRLDSELHVCPICADGMRRRHDGTKLGPMG